MALFSSFTFPITGGAEERTLPDRLDDFVNVAEFGAVGDGSTDNYAVLMNALHRKSITITPTQNVYTGAIRLASATWNGIAGSASDVSTITAITVIPHGLTSGDVVRIINNFSSGGVDAAENTSRVYNGNYTITVLNSTTFTYPMTGDPLVCGYLGCVRPKVSSVIWSGGAVTITFGCPHRLPSGISVTVSGCGAVDGARTIASTPTNKTLTITLADPGAVTPTASAYVSQLPVITVVSVPPLLLSSSTRAAYRIAEFYPTTSAGHFDHQVSGSTATTLSFVASSGRLFQHDITAGQPIRLARNDIGTLFFPSGTYNISETLKVQPGIGCTLRGAGRSTIYGDFPDFLIQTVGRSAASGFFNIERMRFVNDDPAGKGARMVCVGQTVIDCVFEANTGLTFSLVDYKNSIAFSTRVHNCIFTPGLNQSGSTGFIATQNDGSVMGCYFKDLDYGITLSQFGQNVSGNKFVNCLNGMVSGRDPINGQGILNISSICGNHTKNCGAGLYFQGATGKGCIDGNFFEGGVNADYGFKSTNQGAVRFGQFSGNVASGNFATRAISVSTDQTWKTSSIRSCMATNSGGTAWTLPTTNVSATVENCNTAQVFTYSGLRGRSVASAMWSGGTVTVTTDSTHSFANSGFEVSGVAIGGSTANGYNGIFPVILQTGGTSIATYAVAASLAAADANTGSIVSVSLAREYSRGIKTITWLGGIASVEVLGPHYLMNGSTVTISSVWVGGNSSNSFNGTFTPTVTGASTFTYTTTDPGGTANSGQLSATTDVDRSSKAHARTDHGIGSGWRDSKDSRSFFDISDGQHKLGGTANIGDTVKGGGSQRILVGWKGETGWVRVG